MQFSPRLHSCPPTTSAGLTQWRSAITRGNRAFDEGDHARAIDCYRRACRVAASFFGQIGDADAGVAALVVAHHNLADACERLNDPAEQGAQLCVVHEHLCMAMDDPELDGAWRAAAWRHSRRTYVELMCFAGLHPGHARAHAALALCAGGPASEALAH